MDATAVATNSTTETDIWAAPAGERRPAAASPTLPLSTPDAGPQTLGAEVVARSETTAAFPAEPAGRPASPMAWSPLPRAGAPEMVPLGLPGVSWVLGRIAYALALAGLAWTADEALVRGRARQADWFWSQIGLLGVMVVIGLLATVWWSASVCANARRLRLRTVRPGPLVAAWTLPLVWVGVAAAGLMHIDVNAEVDPMPGVAGLGFAIACAVPYGAMSGVLRSLSRRSVTGWWWIMYVIDVVAFGLAWNLLAEASPSDGHAPPTWRVDAMWLAALAMVGAALIAVIVAASAPRLLRARTNLLEARRAGTSEPAWFRTGLVRDPGSALTGAERPLLPTSLWRSTTSVVAVAGGLGLAAMGVIAVQLAVSGSDHATSFLRHLIVASCALAAVHIAAHGIWSAMVCVNARRTSVRGSVPIAGLLLALPVPVTVAVAVWVADELAPSVVVVGLVVAHGAYVASIWMLGTVMANLRGALHHFRLWLVVSLLAAGAALCALATLMPVVGLGHASIAPSLATTAWAVLLVAGAAPGHRARRALDARVLGFRQARRLPRARRIGR